MAGFSIGNSYNPILMDSYKHSKEILSDIQREWYQDAGEKDIINSIYRNVYSDCLVVIKYPKGSCDTCYVSSIRKR